MQISISVQQLDKITQENTAASEEMSASAVQLAGQAEAMNDAVGYFDVAGGDAGAADPSRGGAPAHDAPTVDRKPAPRAETAPRKPQPQKAPARAAGGFDFDLEAGTDDLDARFRRRDAA
jgi:methyl-accepting chemotaxis protein